MTDAQLYWDDQDPKNEGWWLSYRNERGDLLGIDLDAEKDASTEELALAVTKTGTGLTGKVAVIRGQRRGWIKVEDGISTDWKAAT